MALPNPYIACSKCMRLCMIAFISRFCRCYSCCVILINIISGYFNYVRYHLRLFLWHSVMTKILGMLYYHCIMFYLFCSIPIHPVLFYSIPFSFILFFIPCILSYFILSITIHSTSSIHPFGTTLSCTFEKSYLWQGRPGG